MDITLPYVRERERERGKGRGRKHWWKGREKNLFAAARVNKYIRTATETDVAPAKRKCRGWRRRRGRGDERTGQQLIQ